MNTENNKIIAEFMGYKKSIANTWFKGNKIVQTTSFKYDSDWNWLMEVVEKIESFNFWTCLTGSLFEIGMIGSSDSIIFHAGSLRKETRIQAVYNGCIEFIKWYNLNK